MSFKRADDDSQSLHDLRRRRVGDLLREDIADDEVSRLSNGRFVCMVCHHRPIFDTLNMFCIHKQGKKHTQNAAYKAVEKQELEDLVMKKKHEQYVKTGTTDIPQAPASVLKGLGCGKPYDPRTKKHSKPFDRKRTLDINTQTSSSNLVSLVQSASKEELPGNRKEFTGYNRKSRISIDRITKNGCNRKSLQPSLNEYHKDSLDSQEKHSKSELKGKLSVNGSKTVSGDNTSLNAEQLGKFVAKVGQEHDPSYYIAQRKRLKAVTTCSNRTLPNETTGPNAISSEIKSTVDWEKFQKYKSAIMSDATKVIPAKKRKQNDSTVVSSSSVSKQKQTLNCEKVNQMASLNQNCDSGRTEETNKNEPAQNKRAKAERELQLRGAGWKRDWTGKWVKDEDAEFDSDEEAPDFP